MAVSADLYRTFLGVGLYLNIHIIYYIISMDSQYIMNM